MKFLERTDIMYISENCDWMTYGTNLELDKKVKSVYLDARVEAVKSGYGLDVLINDKNEYKLFTNL